MYSIYADGMETHNRCSGNDNRIKARMRESIQITLFNVETQRLRFPFEILEAGKKKKN